MNLRICFTRASKLRHTANSEKILKTFGRNDVLTFMICHDLIRKEHSIADAQKLMFDFYMFAGKSSFGRYRFFLDEFDSFLCKYGSSFEETLFDKKDEYFAKFTHLINSSSFKELELSANPNENFPKILNEYHGVVLGGTFDNMHAGHELLLTLSTYLAKNKIVVGVTDDDYVSKRKQLPEFIDPAASRVIQVKQYIQSIKPSVNEVIVEEMNDGYGPSIREKDLNAIVVSTETVKGGEAVIKKRLELGLCRLDIEKIDIIIDSDSDDSKSWLEDKLSSSNRRKGMLGRRLSPAKEPATDSKVYVIGVTGGIASGKSALSKKLVKVMSERGQRADYIDCDQLGHEAYKAGSDCFNKVVNRFGRDIVKVDNGIESIDRAVLGAKVFEDRQSLHSLNEIVWPEIRKALKSEMAERASQNVKFVIVEAALLIEAQWTDLCHEIFTCIIPNSMAIERVTTRNTMLSADQAKQRIESQITNKERLSQSTFAFSTQWDHSITFYQVEKAVDSILSDYKIF
ncbi:bifunctional coenzyme A synthase-like [Convolutriloba macropyga]|uniref:bifunctional coenzyme A synthase-like n=1 Tax=Convolutriloba macropyga TaxID=536237 RepID=UPI003F5238AC